MPVQASSPDFVAIVTNAGVFAAAVGAVIAAIWGAVKKIRSVSDDDPKGKNTKIIGGAILDNHTRCSRDHARYDRVPGPAPRRNEGSQVRHDPVKG
jgi:hypothetical protein